MKDKTKFKVSAILAMTILFLIYCPTAGVGYFSLGDCVQDNVIMSMTNGHGLKTAAECIILLHLVAALPIAINPPSQFFEELLHIPQGIYSRKNLYANIFAFSEKSCQYCVFRAGFGLKGKV